MLDIQFIQNMPAFDGVVLYRTRTGYLRPVMREVLERAVEESWRILDECTAGELEQTWTSEGLFQATRICELAGQNAAREFERLAAKFEVPPSEPTVIIVKAATWNHGTFRNVTLVDEPEISKENINGALEYLAKSSKFAAAQTLLKQVAFQRYFRGWIDEKIAVPMPDLAKRFDRAILLYTKPGTVDFAPPSDAVQNPTANAFLSRALGRYLDCPTAGLRRAVIQAVAKRAGLGFNHRALMDQLMLASLRLVLGRCHPNRKRVDPVQASTDAALLWAALVAVRASRVSDATARYLPASLVVGHLMSEFEERLNALQDDPLEGLWSDLTADFSYLRQKDQGAEDTEMSPLAQLLGRLAIESAKRRHPAWILKLGRLAQKSDVQDPAVPIRSLGVRQPPELVRFDDVVGQSHVVDEMKSRILSFRNDQPLLLIGPRGAGRRSLARLYARALLCEDRADDEVDPCGRCSQCLGFGPSPSAWGFLEFDMSRADIVQWSKYHIDQLRFEPIARHRVLILKNLDLSQEAADTFLKTLEDGVKNTAFVILTDGVRHARAAAISRSASFRVDRLERSDSMKLLRWWFPSSELDHGVLELIVQCGRGRPGLMWPLAQRVATSEATTLKNARELLNLSWGERALNYLLASLDNYDEEAERLLLQIDVEPCEAPKRIRVVLLQLFAGDRTAEAPMIGLDHKLEELQGSLMSLPGRERGGWQDVWKRLADHWRRDEVTDQLSLAEAGKKAQAIIRCAKGA